MIVCRVIIQVSIVCRKFIDPFSVGDAIKVKAEDFWRFLDKMPFECKYHTKKFKSKMFILAKQCFFTFNLTKNGFKRYQINAIFPAIFQQKTCGLSFKEIYMRVVSSIQAKRVVWKAIKTTESNVKYEKKSNNEQNQCINDQ